MIWLAWRRQRLQVLVSLGVIALAASLRLLAAALAPGKGEPVTDLYEGLDAYVSPTVMLGLAIVLGAFAGGPLFARETSGGTRTFVLSQSVNRWRWWVWRLVIATVPIAVALLVLARVYSATHEAQNVWFTMFTPAYESYGTLLAGYFLLTAVIGATAGLFVKSSTAAMAIAVAAYVVIAVFVSGFARPHLVPSQHYEQEIARDAQGFLEPSTPEGLVVDTGFADADGNPIRGVVDKCEFDYQCIRERGAVVAFTDYHPLNHYWPLQWVETGLTVTIAMAAAGLGAWRLRRWYG